MRQPSVTLKISLQISLHRQRSPQPGRRRKFIWLYGNKRSQPVCAMCSFKMIASDHLLNLKHGSRPFTQGAVSDITPTRPPDRRHRRSHQNKRVPLTETRPKQTQRRNPQSSATPKATPVATASTQTSARQNASARGRIAPAKPFNEGYTRLEQKLL